MSSGGRFLSRLAVLLVLCLSGGSVFSFYSLLYDQNDITEPTVVLVEKGESVGQIARRMKKMGLLDSVSLFKVAARLSGKSTHLKAGEYRIPAHASTKEILDILVSGQTVVRRVMIPEGKTSRQIFDLLMQTPGLFGDLPEPPPNGSLLPETYVFSYGLPRTVIVKRMQDGMTRAIDELWPYRDDDLPYTTKEEALVLASIVEKETSIPAERPRIAGVFVNRLRKGMRLQTDPTVIYAVTDGTMEMNRRLTHKDLRLSHPFNTYVRKGLPPAPICNPGRDSVQAVLQPQKTDEIYFVADGTGGHVFSRTFEEHKRNIALWKRARQQKRRAASAALRAAAKKTPAASSAVKAAAIPVKTAPVPVKIQAAVTQENTAEEIIEREDLSLDIVDDIIAEQAMEKPVDPEKMPVPAGQAVKKGK